MLTYQAKLFISLVKHVNIWVYVLTKICIIEVYLLKYYFESNNRQTILIQSIKYYSILRRYNWSMP